MKLCFFVVYIFIIPIPASATSPNFMTAMSLNERYKKTGNLGEGAYRQVYEAIDQQTGEYVAVKQIKQEHDNEGVPATAMREISLLKELQHDYIVKLKRVVHQNHRLYLIFEHCDMDLKRLIDRSVLSPDVMKEIVRQMVAGIEFCHSHRVLHRDLKP